MFPSTLGTVLGINVPTGERKMYFGIAAQGVWGFRHEVELQVQGFGQWTKLKIGFIDALQVPLLGQSGFFENYQIVFERYRYSFDVYPKLEALMRGRKGQGPRGLKSLRKKGR